MVDRHINEAFNDRALQKEEIEQLRAEVAAWRERFPEYEYRPQDHGVFRKWEFR